MAAIKGGESLGIEAGDQRRDCVARPPPGASRRLTQRRPVGNGEQGLRMGNPISALTARPAYALQFLPLVR
jgi:hypothetical protein